MEIVVVTRTLNEENNVENFVNSYSFADKILVSDGGSTDNTVEKLSKYDKVMVFDSPYKTMTNGIFHNPDNPNINFIINKGLELNPDFIILDDFDDFPNLDLQRNARQIIESCKEDQINAFRLYMWNDDQFYPKMNNYFDPIYRSLWGWYPSRRKIYADETKDHGTILGLSPSVYSVELPNCLLHYSWNEKTIQQKVDRYNQIGLPMELPNKFAGTPEKKPEYAVYK